MTGRCRVHLVRVALLLALAFEASSVRAATVTSDLAAELSARGPRDEIAVIISLADRVDPRAYESSDRSARDTRLARALIAKARATQPAHRVFLQNLGARNVRELWVTNAIAATVPARVVPQLASRPGIARVSLDSTLQAPATTTGVAAAPEWNLDAVQAPALWALGHTGAGIVVANMDTGVDAAHPDLAGKWRGGSNSWFDPHSQHASPYDRHGHGTQTMGLIVGGAAGGTAIGMAPDARWIAVKLYDDSGAARYSDIHLSFQWLLDPDGDLATVDAPDVVNASWGLAGTAGQCISEFDNDIAALRAAGIAIAFAAGNDGPAPLTSLSPANGPQGFAAGAVDHALAVASFSSRGPSACDAKIYPDLVAPGVNVRTADLSFGGLPQYVVLSGTSYAAPHVAGAMVLLAGAFPNASVAQLEAALMHSAQDLGAAGEDNSYGFGLANVQAAFQFLQDGTDSPPVFASTPPTSATAGNLYRYLAAATDADGDALAYSLDVAPGGMSVNPLEGVVDWTPGANQVGIHPVILRATDTGGQSATQSFSLTVSAPNRAPLAGGDAWSVASASTLTVAAPGLLGNDSDPDGNPLTAVLVSGTAKGSLTLQANGSFVYTPNSGFAGADSFSYRAFDGTLYSASATVAITVQAANKPPVAKDDSATAAMRKSASYTPVRIAVLANDSDPEGQLNASSVTIAQTPNQGGSVAVNADGSVSYVPQLKFRGKETFRYSVRDNAGTTSNVATVTVTVK
jgi:serine protease AprX